MLQLDIEMQEMLVYAFRYCLGRSTYAVSSCVDAIVRYWPQLTNNYQILIHGEIIAAISRNQYGMEMDKRQWERVLELKSNHSQL